VPLSQLKLRQYTLNDLDAIFRMDERCFAEPFRFSRDAMEQFAESSNAYVPLAEIDGALAGFAILHLEGETGYIVTLDVDEAFRRKGVAQSLMGRMEQHAREYGASAIFLHVHERNLVAVAFYDHNGFEQVDVDENFYGNGFHALVYRRLLTA
jgi:ribosomal protein S18 acetylase RimI-like enzyme